MTSPTFAIQYLEDSPDIATLSPGEVQTRLRAAHERLPLSCVLLGWHLPDALLHACAAETAHIGARLYRWHPLLTQVGVASPRPEWQVIGLDGRGVAGFRGLPEFTFICPNRPAAREAALSYLDSVIRRGDYQGVFLDRMRYPSPAAAPQHLLACFCPDCGQAAAAQGLDLIAMRQEIADLLATPAHLAACVHALLGDPAPPAPIPGLKTLRAFLDFRARSITQFIQEAAALIHAAGLEVGLDCFSSALAPMVGQDLSALTPHCEWIKIMAYDHVLGPAGVPFELLDLANWLMARGAADETGALQTLTQATHLPLPPTRAALRAHGLPPEALTAQVQIARAAGVKNVWAGVELVEIAEVCELTPAQLQADMRALRAAAVDGIVLSWDLRHIPLERLDLVRAAWE